MLSLSLKGRVVWPEVGVQYRSVLFVFFIVNTVENKSFNIPALTLDLLDITLTIF